MQARAFSSCSVHQHPLLASKRCTLTQICRSRSRSSQAQQRRLHVCSSSLSSSTVAAAAHAADGGPQYSPLQGSFGSSRQPPRRARALVRTHSQAEKRVARITVAGPPSQAPRVIEVDDPQVVAADVLSFNQIQHELQARQASVSKSEAREQAAIIQAQRQEITSLRQALAETQDVMLKGKQTYNQVMHTKDLQIAQLYELAASGVRERAKLRQEVNEVQTELQGTRRQLHSFMASLMQLKNSMASAGEGDLEHALELLQSSSYSASLNNANQLNGTNLTEDEVMAQLQQMQQLSETLVQDMRQDEALLSQGMATRSGSSSANSTWDFDSMDSADMFSSSSGGGSSSSSAGGSTMHPSTPRQASNSSSGAAAAAAAAVRNPMVPPPTNGGGSSGGSSQRPGSNGAMMPPPTNGSSGGGGNGSHGGKGSRWSSGML